MRFLALLELRPPITEEEKARIAKAPKELNWRGVVAFLAVLMGALASILQESIGLFALPDFEGALNVTADQGYWTLTSYTIGEVGITPLAPFLFLLFGGRRLLLTCSTLFALSAAAVYLPLGFGGFLALRFFQGMAAGPLVPMLMIAALRIFPAHLRSIALTGYAFIVIFGPAIAPSFSGYIVVPFGWGSVFLYPVPFCFLVIAGALFGFRREPINWDVLAKADIFGMVTLVLGIAALIAGSDNGPRYNWFESGFVTGLFSAAATCFAVFIWHELSIANPLLNLKLLTIGNLAVAMIFLVIFTVVVQGTALLIPSFLTNIAQYRPDNIGNIERWIAWPQFILCPLAALILRRIDARLPLALAFAMIAVSYALLTYVTAAWRTPNFLVIMMIQSIGLPLFMVSLLTVTTSILDPTQGPTGSALFNGIRALGSSINADFLLGVQQSRERVHAYYISSSPIPGSWAYDESVRLHGLQAAQSAVSQQATVMSYADCFGIIGVLCVFAIFIVPLLHETRLPVKPVADAA
jgi:MFS transporter, DHA2 family, multidrug resistance protein